MAQALHRILLVEDNADIRTVVKASLELMGGFEVRACASGAEAFDALIEFAPQLILLDVMMPDMDGLAVLEGMRARPDTAGVPVIFLTAKTGETEVRRLRAHGALDVLGKPFDPLTLHERIKAAWDLATS